MSACSRARRVSLVRIRATTLRKGARRPDEGGGRANPLLNGARPESFISRLCDSLRIARSIIVIWRTQFSSFRSRASALSRSSAARALRRRAASGSLIALANSRARRACARSRSASVLLSFTARASSPTSVSKSDLRTFGSANHAAARSAPKVKPRRGGQRGFFSHRCLHRPHALRMVARCALNAPSAIQSLGQTENCE